MKLNELCQKIRLLVAEIFSVHKELEENIETSHLKVRDSISLFVEAVKKVAPISIEHSGSHIGNVQRKYLVWHEEFGIGVQSQSQIKPLVIHEGDFQVEQLVKIVQSRLNHTLEQMQVKKSKTTQRIDQLEQLIVTLKEWERDSA